tara:strand:- start:893 stop:1273 length:381 start_codon:yes stop_codon:yes gene_type:complete
MNIFRLETVTKAQMDKYFIRKGFTRESTGGGCYAYVLEIPYTTDTSKTFYIYVAGADEDIPTDPSNMGASIENNDGRCFSHYNGTLVDIIVAIEISFISEMEMEENPPKYMGELEGIESTCNRWNK